MSRSAQAIAARFRKLLDGLAPRGVDVGRAKTSLAGIRNRLGRTQPVVKTLWIGSHAKGTAIRSRSDVDLMVVVSRDSLRWGGTRILSSSLLDRFRRDLADRYPSTTISRDGQAVSIRFGAGRPSVDVVPAVFHRMGPNRSPVYLIPDGTGDWLTTSPELELRAFRRLDLRSQRKASQLVRLMKAWRYARVQPVPVQGIHIERVVSAYEVGVGAYSYSRLLTELLRILATRGGSALRDPLGISGLVPLSRTPAQLDSAVRSLQHSADHALRARDAEECGDTGEAIRQWRLVFNGNFPARLS